MLTELDTVKIFRKEPENIKVPAGTFIYKEGEEGNSMYGIISGQIDFIINGKTLDTLETGDTFGEGALVVPDHKRIATAVAKTDCELVTLDQERFMFAVQETPLFALEVMRSFYIRVNKLAHALGVK
jgi:CRP-like cAMP-binding protein